MTSKQQRIEKTLSCCERTRFDARHYSLPNREYCGVRMRSVCWEWSVVLCAHTNYGQQSVLCLFVFRCNNKHCALGVGKEWTNEGTMSSSRRLWTNAQIGENGFEWVMATTNTQHTTVNIEWLSLRGVVGCWPLVEHSSNCVWWTTTNGSKSKSRTEMWRCTPICRQASTHNTTQHSNIECNMSNDY